MAKQLDPQIAEILKRHGYGPEACWNVHGTWVVYHRVLEQIAVQAGITFDPPMVLEADGQSKTVALCVTGHMKGGPSHWSIGEASPHNYQVKGKQAAYPYAMAEKRAVDRVVLKLIGLHGLAYSEDEADDFTPPKAAAEPAPTIIETEVFRSFRDDLALCETEDELANWASRVKTARARLVISDDEREALMPHYKERAHHIAAKREAA